MRLAANVEFYEDTLSIDFISAILLAVIFGIGLIIVAVGCINKKMNFLSHKVDTFEFLGILLLFLQINDLIRFAFNFVFICVCECLFFFCYVCFFGVLCELS